MAKNKKEQIADLSQVASPETNVDLPEQRAEEIPSPEPLTQTEQENTVLAEAEKGIDQALSENVLLEVPGEPILPQVFTIGEIVQVGKSRAIIIDYEKFVKYVYGLIILGNPGLATSYVSQAGKGKLFQLLGITDREIQEKTWSEFKLLYNELYKR